MKSPEQDPTPDFSNLRRALLRQGEPKRVPQFELSVDDAIKCQFLGRDAGTLETEVAFFMRAGYDFVPITIGMRQATRGETTGLMGAKPEQTAILKAVTAQYNPFQPGTTTRMWAEEGQGIIHDEESFDSFSWPSPDDFTYDTVERLGRLMPDGAKAIVCVGAVFTASWMLMGMEAFCIAVAEGSDLVTRLLQRVGETQLKVVENLLQFDCVGAICMPDDLAYTSGLIVSPRILRKYVFPWNKQIGDRVHSKGLPYVYHSDGRIYDVLGDLVACGFDAVHPCEPSSIDIVELKREYGDRLCLCGNINLDSTLTLGSPADVEAEVKTRICALGPGGGYCCGSSNSVPEYVPYPNYIAMIESVKRFGRYPITV
jgi:uroporphyrinogen decarboxylase